MASYETVYRELHALLQSYTADRHEISPSSLLVDDLGLDSMQTMEMVMDMEDRLDMAIPLNVLPEVQTVDDLTRALVQVAA
ncbi:acyl carrier protein [Salinisphaera sp. T31B1]|uniref:acyl carrier protein n=1 Tax=Salinisphaera sp. T31B1 TaxID=727963 RepID=UPI003341F805